MFVSNTQQLPPRKRMSGLTSTDLTPGVSLSVIGNIHSPFAAISLVIRNPGLGHMRQNFGRKKRDSTDLCSVNTQYPTPPLGVEFTSPSHLCWAWPFIFSLASRR